MGVPQTLVLYGTSLSYHLAPPLRVALRERFGELATVINSGMAARASRSGLDELEPKVLRHAPDAIWLEFAINDAYSYEEFGDETRDKGITLSESRDNVLALIERIEQAQPRCEIGLQITNPAFDDARSLVLGATRRPNLPAFYAQTREVAAARHLRLLDATAMWQALFEAESGWQHPLPDGVHPTPRALRDHLVPFLLRQNGIF